MSVAARTKRLAGPTTLTTSHATLYTVPSGRSAMLKLVHFADRSSGLGVTWGLNLNGTAASDRIITGASLPSGSWGSELLELALNAGDFISMIASANTRVVITLSGFEYLTS